MHDKVHARVQFTEYSVQISKFFKNQRGMKNLKKVDFRVISPLVRGAEIFSDFRKKSLKWQILRDFRAIM